MIPSLWIVFTVLGALFQTLRNVMQRSLTGTLGTVGATHVRFLYGLPFSILFLAAMLVATHGAVVWPTPIGLAWSLAGAISQIVATALMLASMRDRSFLVTIAYTKTEPVQVTLIGAILLAEIPNALTIAAVLIATFGVLLMSWPRRAAAGAAEPWSWRPALYGIASGGLFGLAAVCFRGGIQTLGSAGFLVAASTILVVSLALQTLILTVYLVAVDRPALKAILKAWRPSLAAGFFGAFASQLWFLAFAIEPVAHVRTLGLVEILFAQVMSRNLMKQMTSGREGLGIALLVVGVLMVLNA